MLLDTEQTGLVDLDAFVSGAGEMGRAARRRNQTGDDADDDNDRHDEHDELVDHVDADDNVRQDFRKLCAG